MSTEKQHQDRTIDYIEFNVADIARSKDFYGKAFGWSFTDYGPDYCEFSDGHMKGGFNATGPVRLGGALVVLYGAGLDEILVRIEQAGAKSSNRFLNFQAGDVSISLTRTATNLPSGRKVSHSSWINRPLGLLLRYLQIPRPFHRFRLRSLRFLPLSKPGDPL